MFDPLASMMFDCDDCWTVVEPPPPPPSARRSAALD
jgi:hypothetical protein